MSKKSPGTSLHKTETRLLHAGRDPQRFDGAVNIPAIHASTIVFPDAESFRSNNHPAGSHYGRAGTSTTRALEEAVAALEGGDRSITFPSGAAAIAATLSALTSTGDHVLIADNVYGPTRRFANQVLSRTGVEFTFFDPMIGANIASSMKNNTKLIYIESPGSESFEVCDVPALVRVAKESNILTIFDNTWSGGLYFKPFEHGVDVSVHAGTKYIGGHADTMLGLATATESLYPVLRQTAINFGYCAGPDVCYLGLRGMRTLGVRLPKHYENGLRLAEWLMERNEVQTVLHPALPSCPGHEFWKRDFSGASGLFGVVLREYSTESVNKMLNGMELYAMGYSWGGYESLLIPTHPSQNRSATTFPHKGPTLRIHAGLENFEDLRDDLAAGLDRLSA